MHIYYTGILNSLTLLIKNAQLYGALFQHAQLYDALFKHAQLYVALFKHAQLYGALFKLIFRKENQTENE